jgi:hypothetical protein
MLVTKGFEQVWMTGGYPAEGVAGTNLGNGALVAIQATIVAHLQKERTVTKPVTSLDTLGAANTKLLVDGVFVVGILDETALDRRSWAEAILSAGVKIVRRRFEIARAQLAIPANGVGVDTFHR